MAAIPPRPWLGFFGESTSADASGDRPAPIPIAQRRWLEFVPAPRARGTAALGLSAIGGIFAVGLVAGVLAIGAEAEGNESDGAVMETPDGDGDAIAHASAVPMPEREPPTTQSEPAEVVAAPVVAPTPPVAATRPPKKIEYPPMPPAQLRKAQRVAKMLEAAVAEGDVKSSTLSFAVIADSQGTFWADATTVCNDLSIDGVTGWRLPSIGELRDLGRARALPGAAYWSRTRGSDPDMARVYNTRTRRSGSWLATEPTGAAVCVQPRPR